MGNTNNDLGRDTIDFSNPNQKAEENQESRVSISDINVDDIFGSGASATVSSNDVTENVVTPTTTIDFSNTEVTNQFVNEIASGNEEVTNVTEEPLPESQVTPDFIEPSLTHNETEAVEFHEQGNTIYPNPKDTITPVVDLNAVSKMENESTLTFSPKEEGVSSLVDVQESAIEINTSNTLSNDSATNEVTSATVVLESNSLPSTTASTTESSLHGDANMQLENSIAIGTVSSSNPATSNSSSTEAIQSDSKNQNKKKLSLPVLLLMIIIGFSLVICFLNKDVLIDFFRKLMNK